MQSEDLTKEQWGKLESRIGQEVQYLSAVVERMIDQGFPDSDPLKVKTLLAYQALTDLLAHVRIGAKPEGGYPVPVSFGPNPEYDEISEGIAPAVDAANKSRRWKR